MRDPGLLYGTQFLVHGALLLRSDTTSGDAGVLAQPINLSENVGKQIDLGHTPMQGSEVRLQNLRDPIHVATSVVMSPEAETFANRLSSFSYADSYIFSPS